MPGPKGLPAALLWAWPGKKNACPWGVALSGRAVLPRLQSAELLFGAEFEQAPRTPIRGRRALPLCLPLNAAWMSRTADGVDWTLRSRNLPWRSRGAFLLMLFRSRLKPRQGGLSAGQKVPNKRAVGSHHDR
jgi:hypothetical protein